MKGFGMNISAAGHSAVGHYSNEAPPAHDPHKLLSPTAQLFSMSVAQLQAATRSGVSLESIASERGVKRVELVDALKEGLVAARPNGAPDISGTSRFDRLADSIATRSSPARGDEPATQAPPPPTTGPANSNGQLDALASLLDMSRKELVDSMLEGQSLQALAEQNGVSFDSLRSELERGLLLDMRV